jgi:hypothetical protein
MVQKDRMTNGTPRPRDDFLYPSDDAEEFRIPSEVADWTWKVGLWDRINNACGTDIDEYEGVTLEPLDLVRASEIIRQALAEVVDLSSEIVRSMSDAAAMLEACAERGVSVMFSL